MPTPSLPNIAFDRSFGRSQKKFQIDLFDVEVVYQCGEGDKQARLGTAVEDAGLLKRGARVPAIISGLPIP